jgi:hypothetical protein
MTFDEDLTQCGDCGKDLPSEFLICGLCSGCRIKARTADHKVIEDIKVILQAFADEDEQPEE